MAAVPAGRLGGDVGADEAEDSGERDESRIQASGSRGAGGCGRGDVVDEQQCPGFLAGQVRGLAAQRAAGAADRPFQVEERDFNQPPLMPVKEKSSLAHPGHPGRY